MEEEFKELYAQYWHHVFAYVYNIFSDQQQSEDIVQEIFIDPWNRYDDLDIRKPKSYLFQISIAGINARGCL